MKPKEEPIISRKPEIGQVKDFWTVFKTCLYKMPTQHRASVFFFLLSIILAVLKNLYGPKILIYPLGVLLHGIGQFVMSIGIVGFLWSLVEFVRSDQESACQERTAPTRKRLAPTDIDRAQVGLQRIRHERVKSSSMIEMNWNLPKEVAYELGDMVDYLIRDFVSPWYKSVSNDNEFINDIQELMGNAMGSISVNTRDNADLIGLAGDKLIESLTLHLKYYGMAKAEVRQTNPELFDDDYIPESMDDSGDADATGSSSNKSDTSLPGNSNNSKMTASYADRWRLLNTRSMMIFNQLRKWNRLHGMFSIVCEADDDVDDDNEDDQHYLVCPTLNMQQFCDDSRIKKCTREYLRNLTSSLTKQLLFADSDKECKGIRHLAREILANNAFMPLMDLLAPDNFNLWIIFGLNSYLSRSTTAAASSIEDDDDIALTNSPIVVVVSPPALGKPVEYIVEADIAKMSMVDVDGILSKQDVGSYCFYKDVFEVQNNINSVAYVSATRTVVHLGCIFLPANYCMLDNSDKSFPTLPALIEHLHSELSITTPVRLTSVIPQEKLPQLHRLRSISTSSTVSTMEGLSEEDFISKQKRMIVLLDARAAVDELLDYINFLHRKMPGKTNEVPLLVEHGGVASMQRLLSVLEGIFLYKLKQDDEENEGRFEIDDDVTGGGMIGTSSLFNHFNATIPTTTKPNGTSSSGEKPTGLMSMVMKTMSWKPNDHSNSTNSNSSSILKMNVISDYFDHSSDKPASLTSSSIVIKPKIPPASEVPVEMEKVSYRHFLVHPSHSALLSRRGEGSYLLPTHDDVDNLVPLVRLKFSAKYEPDIEPDLYGRAWLLRAVCAGNSATVVELVSMNQEAVESFYDADAMFRNKEELYHLVGILKPLERIAFSVIGLMPTVEPDPSLTKFSLAGAAFKATESIGRGMQSIRLTLKTDDVDGKIELPSSKPAVAWKTWFDPPSTHLSGLFGNDNEETSRMSLSNFSLSGLVPNELKSGMDSPLIPVGHHVTFCRNQKMADDSRRRVLDVNEQWKDQSSILNTNAPGKKMRVHRLSSTDTGYKVDLDSNRRSELRQSDSNPTVQRRYNSDIDFQNPAELLYAIGNILPTSVSIDFSPLSFAESSMKLFFFLKNRPSLSIVIASGIVVSPKSEHVEMVRQEHSHYIRRREKLQDIISSRPILFRTVSCVKDLSTKQSSDFLNEMDELSLCRFKLHAFIVEIVKDYDKPAGSLTLASVARSTTIYYMVQVIMKLPNAKGNYDDDCDVTSWFTRRRYSDFYHLHKHLQSQTCLDLPPFPSKKIFSSGSDRPFLEDRKSSLDFYLQSLLRDDRLGCCNELFTFLSPLTNAMVKTLVHAADDALSFNESSNLSRILVIPPGPSGILLGLLYRGQLHLQGLGELPQTTATVLKQPNDILLWNNATDMATADFLDDDLILLLDANELPQYVQDLLHSLVQSSCADVTYIEKSHKSIRFKDLAIGSSGQLITVPEGTSDSMSVTSGEADGGHRDDDDDDSSSFITLTRMGVIEGRIYQFAKEFFEYDALGVLNRRYLSLLRRTVKIFFSSTMTKWLSDQCKSYMNVTGSVWLLKWVKERVWPGGILVKGRPPREPEEVLKSLDELCALAHKAVPYAFLRIFGSFQSYRSIFRLIDMLQNPYVVRNLLISTLDMLMIEIFPDLEQELDGIRSLK